MFRYFARRIIQSVFLILGVVFIVFFMIRINGDPVSLMISRDATMEQREAFRKAHGFDRPVSVQFADYLVRLSQGDLGNSLQYRLPASALIQQRLIPTFELAFSTLIFIAVFSIPLGILAGLYPNTPFDLIARFIALLGQTLGSFWLAMLLIFFVAVPIDILPTFGRDGFASLILPMIALGLGGVGQMLRLTRATVLEVRHENYIRTANAKGVSPRNIATRHILLNAALPLISVLGIQFTYLLGGSVYIETIFSWPGLGTLLEGAINNRDFPLVQAITFIIALFAISINLLTDLIYMLLDPRIREATG